MASLDELSRRCAARIPLQYGPDYPEVLSDREIGGPLDPADRRLVVDTRMLEALLDVARSSPSGRAVVHHFGLRVQVLRDDSGHTWEHVRLVGDRPVPEMAMLGVKS